MRRNSIPARRFTAGLTSNSSRPRWMDVHIFADGTWPAVITVLAYHNSQRARCQSAVEKNCPSTDWANADLQIRHQLVGLEPQRRLLVGLAGEDWLGRANHAL